MRNLVDKRQFQQTIMKLMQEAGLYNENIKQEIPTSWEIYGDLVLFRNTYFKSADWFVLGEDLWKRICDMLKCKRIGLKGKIKNDEFRTPVAKLIYGEPREVNFTDNGIKYSWNLERCMFCRGNALERHRIATLDCRNDVIVDLFAGIGYFTLPYLVKAKAKHVHACEWNPYAVEALKRNLELNNLSENCTIYEGDNRQFCPTGVGNRINVGLIPDSQQFWPTACKALRPSGGIIYIHQNVTSAIKANDSDPCLKCNNLLERIANNDLNKYATVLEEPPYLILSPQNHLVWKNVEWFKFSLHISHTLCSHLEAFHKSKWKVTIQEYFKIKSYAPHIDHLVYGAHCYPS